MWEDLSEEQTYLTSEELVLRNTFLNARMGPVADFKVSKNHKRIHKLKWFD